MARGAPAPKTVGVMQPTTELPKASAVPLRMRVNGELRLLQIDPRATLLDVLREQVQLTGTKKGCDHGQCGACTVHAEGRRILSCLSLALQHQDERITTVEGLADGDELHPMQAAFVAHDALQCGFCTPGQILSAIALLAEARGAVPSHVTPDVSRPPSVDALSDDEIRERMSGNLCRCGAYPNILAAIKAVR